MYGMMGDNCRAKMLFGHQHKRSLTRKEIEKKEIPFSKPDFLCKLIKRAKRITALSIIHIRY